jgi:hypothetical protein
MNMQFSNVYKDNRMKQVNYNISVNNLSFYKKKVYNVLPETVILSQQITNPNLPIEESALMNSRSRWGPAVWFLFHTLAHKIKDNEFINVKMELLESIKAICRNLPCPTCAQHATEYLQRLNYNSIRNKEDLKRFFFIFHNDVNFRKQLPMFSIDELESKYSSANTMNIIRNFIQIFQYKNKSFHMIANDMQRQRQGDLLKIWFNNNIHRFDT